MAKEEENPWMTSDPLHEHSKPTKMEEEEEDLQEGDTLEDHHRVHPGNHWADCQETTIIKIGMILMEMTKVII